MAVSAVLSLSACANRGMVAPGSDAGGVTDSGAGGLADGRRSDTSADAACPGATDAAGDRGACSATFNFESDLQGATIATTGQAAFQSVSRTDAPTFCGAGALAIAAMFSGTTGASVKGEAILPLVGAPVDLTGKSITVHVAASPGCSPDLSLTVVLRTDAGDRFFPVIRPVTADWKTMTFDVASASGGDVTRATAVSLQSTSFTGFVGTIYMDEIAVQ